MSASALGWAECRRGRSKPWRGRPTRTPIRCRTRRPPVPKPRTVYLRRVGPQHRIGLRSGAENQGKRPNVSGACDSEGLQIEQLLHGPFCSVDEKCLITLVAPPGPGYERAMNVSRAANAVGAPVWSLLQEGDALPSALSARRFILPPVPEFRSPPVVDHPSPCGQCAPVGGNALAEWRPSRPVPAKQPPPSRRPPPL